MKILLVNQNWLGDALFSTPAIRAIRKKFPDAYLACWVPPRCAPALKNNPYLNEIMICEDRLPLFSFWKWMALVEQLRKKHFDAAIFFHRSKTRVFLAKLAGIPRRIGYSSPFRGGFLTDVCPAPQEKMHKIDFFLKLAAHFGAAGDGRAMDFFSDRNAETELEMVFQKNGVSKNEPYAVVHAGGNWELKRWPVRYFTEWIRLYLEKSSGKILLCGTKAEEGISREISSSFPGGNVVSLCGQTSLDALALLLKNARFLLSNDSGPIHLAATQKTPVIGLFGPTSPELTGPVSLGKTALLRKDVGCEVPCYYRSCNYRVCMDLLTPEEVFESAVKLVSS
jgi:heptosyltransferase II